MVALRIIDPYSILDFGIPSKLSYRPNLCSTIYYTLLKKFVYSNSSFIYGLFAGHTSSVLTLMLMVSFVDGLS
jgi:hypothetical protein